jgi:hypothetical protein
MNLGRLLRLMATTGVVVLAVLGAAIEPAASEQTKSPAKSPTTQGPTFYKDVLPTLQRHCQSCHRPGQIGKMPLMTFEEARPWARAIRTQVTNRTMPPWNADPQYGHFTNDRSLSTSEIETIKTWVDNGAPAGVAKDAPPPVTWPAQGWQIQPDVTVALPDYKVAADGVLEWEALAIPSPFKQDTWVSSIELLPSEPSTVHHICFEFQDPRPEVVHYKYEYSEIPRDKQGNVERPGLLGRLVERVWSSAVVVSRDAKTGVVEKRSGRPTLKATGTFCYVPGNSTHDYRVFDAAFLVKGGSNIVFTLHYQPTGKPLIDKTRVGFTVAKKDFSKKFIPVAVNGASEQNGFLIPPNEPNYLAPAVDLTIKQDAELTWVWPHMHVRGKDVTYTLIYPNGKREIILKVPRYDFQWQISYNTKIKIPRGTRVYAEAHFDNSRNNKANPDPNSYVYPGDQSWEEMFTPSFGVLVDRSIDPREVFSRTIQ